MPEWLSRPGPGLDPLTALARVADAETLVCLHGGPGGWTHLAWQSASCGQTNEHQDLAGLAEAAARHGQRVAGPDLPGTGWGPCGAGGFIVQLDHEWPAQPPGIFALTTLVSWDPHGACTISAVDASLIDDVREDIARPASPLSAPRLAGPLVPAWDEAGHRQRVAALQEAIAAGAIYQANLTLPFSATLAPGRTREAGLFAALVRASPAPYAALIRLPGRPTVVSHSPEGFLAWRGQQVVSSPIKGTRRRIPGRDAEVRADLLASPKERAELAMIVDLVRHDLGRTAQPGSVQVTEPAALIDLPYVHHLAARITARTSADPAAVIRAAFPPGSVTGCPKQMALELIARHEAGPRGAYCGAFGWIGPHAGELAVAIRTAVIDGDVIRLHAGGGITADSDGAAEWDEAWAKLAGLRAALEGEP